MNYELHLGDNREVLRSMPSDSVDSIVCDPPYELGFMGKKWDSTGIAYDQTLWTECLRVLKPGGHLIAFGGTRTYHRMTVAIEDAGFEIRDCIQWIYGSGFPKSLDVSKAIDKKGGASVDFVRFRDAVIDAMKRNNITRKQLESALGNYMLSHYLTAGSQPAVPNYRDYCIIRDTVCLGNDFDELFNESAEREVVGQYDEKSSPGGLGGQRFVITSKDITAPATPEAQQWHGFGTALKPAVEPAVLARKPLSGTVADNVMTWGCGALNIDGCRVDVNDGDYKGIGGGNKLTNHIGKKLKNDIYQGGFTRTGVDHTNGRWPANVILDEEAAQMLDAQSGHGASRFFYVAKASKAEREAGLDAPPGERGNIHATVKPITLMCYLVRLVTPPGGVVLDPFMGSGSTGCAAMLEGVDFVGIELSAEYLEIARKRIEYWASQNPMGL